METQTDLNNLSIKQIYNIFRDEINNQITFDDIKANYGLHKNSHGHIIKDDNYYLMKRELIDEIQATRNKRDELLKQIPQPIKPNKPYQQPPKLNENGLLLNEVEDMKDNTNELLNHVDATNIDSLLERARKELKKAEQNFDYLKKFKETIEKDKTNDNKRKNEFRKQLDEENDEIRDEYDYMASKSNKSISYNDYLESLKKQNKNISELKDSLNENKDSYEVDFSKFDNIGKKKLNKSLLNWFQNTIRELYTKDKYRIIYRVGNERKSAPLNKETYNKLLNNLNEGNLIYDMETTPEWYYDKDKKYNLPVWSLFDYIRIEKIQNNKSVPRDNGGHFFKYLALESLPKKLIDK